LLFAVAEVELQDKEVAKGTVSFRHLCQASQ